MSLEDRLERAIAPYAPSRQRMFGGTCYMINGNMTICISKRGILARVGPEAAKELVLEQGARAMEMRGKIMPGYLRLDETAVSDDEALKAWVKCCVGFVSALPAKKPAKKAAKKLKKHEQ